jgi:CheY-like chemotaxis protein
MQQHTILLVDDEASNCLLLQRVLERERFHAVTACDGEDALLLYSLVHHDIDLVILDVDMPGKNGAECLETMRRINPDVCCLAITAHIDHPCLSRMLSLGISGILRKPFGNDELIKWTERLMRPHDVERQIRQQTPLRNRSVAN